MMVAPDLNKVHAGFARDDLFTVVHEQFMTDTAKMADIVLPATMFLEHDDIYQGGGHQYVIAGPKIVEPPEGCRSNHEVLQALATRLGVTHPGFEMTARELCDWTLEASGYPGFDELEAARWHDAQPDFKTAHYLNGFAKRRRQVPLRPQLGAVEPPRFRSRGLERDPPPPSRPLGGDRGAVGRKTLPPGDRAGQELSQFLLHRDGDLDPPGGTPDGEDRSGRRGGVGRGRGRARPASATIAATWRSTSRSPKAPGAASSWSKASGRTPPSRKGSA